MQTSCQKSFNCLLSRYFAYKALSRLKMPLRLCINKVQKLTKMNKNINNYFYDQRFHFLKKMGVLLSPLPRQIPQLRAPALASSRLFIPATGSRLARLPMVTIQRSSSLLRFGQSSSLLPGSSQESKKQIFSIEKSCSWPLWKVAQCSQKPQPQPQPHLFYLLYKYLLRDYGVS